MQQLQHLPIVMEFPTIPVQTLDIWNPVFLPSEELRQWVKATFIEDGATLCNDHHKHLRLADVRFLWSSVPNHEKGQSIIGTCQQGKANGKTPWIKGQRKQQIIEWFGIEPTFFIILDAIWCEQADMQSRCALIEHELYHAGQAKNAWGFPKFTKDGLPVFTMRDHDVQEFVGVVDRYGVGNEQHGALREMVGAANRKPRIGQAKIEGACGCCLQKVG